MSSTNLPTAAGARQEGSLNHKQCLPLFLSFDCPPAPLNIPNLDDLVLRKVVAINVGHDWQ